MAEGPDVGLQYFPSGYGVYVRQQPDGRRILPSFEIYNPAIQNNGTESWPWKSSNDIVYRFEWKDSISGKQVFSEIR